MVSLEAMFNTIVIYAYERRDFGNFDVPGEYLHFEIPKYKHVLLKLKWYFLDIMYRVNPEHEKNTVIDKEQSSYICLWSEPYIYALNMPWYGMSCFQVL